jgi:O-antigen ligase/tetratricopeptide (TPR) repeat protein
MTSGIAKSSRLPDRSGAFIGGARRKPLAGKWLRGAQHAIDAGLFGCLLVVPLLLGGRHDLGRLVYAVAVAIATVGTVAKCMVRRQKIELPWLPLGIAGVAALLLLAQVTPLPAALLAVLAPAHTKLLPLWDGESIVGRWSSISLTPSETVEGLALLIAHSLLFVVVTNYVRSREDIRKLLACVCLSVGAACLAVILQQAAPSERFLWVYDLPTKDFSGGVQGVFTNRNHLAHFLAFGAIAATAFATKASVMTGGARARRRSITTFVQRIALGFIVLCAVLLLATQSKGGVIAAAVATTTWIALRRASGESALASIVGACLLLTVALGGVSVFGYEKVTSRLDDVVSGDIEQVDAGGGRRLIWEANLRAFAANPIVGYGAGSHRDVYPSFIAEGGAKEYTHAESGYLQVATETGVIGLILLAAAILVSLHTTVSNACRATKAEDVTLQSGLGAGLVLSFAHSTVDFVWYIPALAALAVVFAACSMRLMVLLKADAAAEGLANDLSPRLETPPRIEVEGQDLPNAFLIGLCCFMVLTLAAPARGSLAWDRYLRVSKTIQALESQAFRTADFESDPHLVDTIKLNIDRSVEELERVVRLDPRNARAHARLTGRLLQQFEFRAAASSNPLSLDMIADTVNSGGFQSEIEVSDWLARAYGDDAHLLSLAKRHAEQGVLCGPLQGECYLHLATLAFITKSSSEGLVDQALTLRPYDGGVRFEAGRRLHLAGDADAALEQYRLSLGMHGSHQGRLVALLAPLMPAAEFLTSLDPRGESMELVLEAYKGFGTQEDLIAIAEHAEVELQSGDQLLSPTDASRRWRQLSIAYRSLKRHENAVNCAKRSYELLPNDFWVRHELAFALHGAERGDEADPHFRWCLARRPDLGYLQQSLKLIGKQKAIRSHAERVDRSQTARKNVANSEAETKATAIPAEIVR